MNKVMNFIISPDQTGFVPGRFICDNNMLLHEIIALMQEKNEQEKPIIYY